MKNMTLLTTEQFQNFRKIDVLDEYGTKAALTDYAILTGARPVSYCYVGKDKTLDTRAGDWWLQTFHDSKSSILGTGVKIASASASFNWHNVTKRNLGIRPVLEYSSIESDVNVIEEFEGVKFVEYGMMPKTVVFGSVYNELENSYMLKELEETEFSHTTDSVSVLDVESTFNPVGRKVYTYNDKKYIRYVADNSSVGQELSDGERVVEGKAYWLEIESIKWIVDEKHNLAITKDIVVSGIQFDDSKEYDGNFENTNIKRFLNNYLLKELEAYELVKNNVDSFEVVKESANPFGLDFSDVDEEDIISDAIYSNLPLYIHGLSGDGKSARVKQIDPTCVVVYLRNSSVDDINGKTVYEPPVYDKVIDPKTGRYELIEIVKGTLKKEKPVWLKRLEEKCKNEPDRLHVLFFDEISNAPPALQGMVFNIFLEREVNGEWFLPENCRVVAAGNDPKESLAANPLVAPLLGRVVQAYIKTTAVKWLPWALEHGIHPSVYSYIACRGDSALRTKFDGITPNATPRKWEMASDMLKATNKVQSLRSLVGPALARDFEEFTKMKIVTLDAVLENKCDNLDFDKMSVDEKFATASTLTIVDNESYFKVRNFVKKLGDEPRALFDSLWSRNDVKRLELVAEAVFLDKQENSKKR